MEEQVKIALKDNGFAAIEINQLTSGSYNTVFKVVLESGQRVVVRIFRSKGWPEAGKLEWVSAQLSQFNIPSAKILFSTRDNRYFPHGFMVQEYVDGEIVQKLVGEDISYAEYFTELGKTMNQVHKIQIPKFGYIGHGTGNHDSLIAYLGSDIDRFFKRIETIMDKLVVEPKVFKQKVLGTLESISQLTSVLNHNDLSPNNVMLNSHKDLVLIDWDNAISHTWLNDFAVMTYWMRNRHKDLAEREEYIKLFLDSYSPNMDYQEIRKVEKTLHSIQALNLLGYYYFDDKNMESFENTLNYFNELNQ